MPCGSGDFGNVEDPRTGCTFSQSPFCSSWDESKGCVCGSWGWSVAGEYENILPDLLDSKIYQMNEIPEWISEILETTLNSGRTVPAGLGKTHKASQKNRSRPL